MFRSATFGEIQFNSFKKFFIYPEGKLNIVVTHIIQKAMDNEGESMVAVSLATNMHRPLTEDCCGLAVS